MMVTLKDIALVCGVSVATVSRALNGSGDISPAQTERICRTAREMGYLPNAAARALKTNRSYMLGILYEDRMDHEYFSLVIEAIRHAAEERGFDLTFLSKTLRDGRADYPEHAARRNLDGAVLVQCRWEEPSVRRLMEGPLPCVSIDYAWKDCPAVVNDNRGSMRQLVRAAWQRGYRRMAFIHGEDGYVTRDRIRGFEEGLLECGLPFAADRVCEARFRNGEASLAAVRSLLDMKEPPDCVFFPDDFSLLSVMDALRQRGIRLTDRFGAVGYDGISSLSYVSPRLFTYRQNTDAIGRTAVESLLNRLNPDQQEHPGTVVIPGEVVFGDTLPDRTSR